MDFARVTQARPALDVLAFCGGTFVFAFGLSRRTARGAALGLASGALAAWALRRLALLPIDPLDRLRIDVEEAAFEAAYARAVAEGRATPPGERLH
jgi:hypothetical protein